MNTQELIGIVCHDAGGAEIVSSYVAQNNLTVRYCLDGPAVGIFERKLGNIENSSMDSVIKEADWFICGTSWQSELEWEATIEAKKLGKKIVCFLDHWVEYDKRFVRKRVEHLPDEIWVGDSYALQLATSEFPAIHVKLVENPYLLDIYKEYKKIHPVNCSYENGINLLFVGENIDDYALKRYANETYYGYTDSGLLRYVIENIYILNQKINKIIVRPHPSETIDKYLQIYEEYSSIIEFGGQVGLLEEIAQCEIVSGGDSMALVVALMCGKRVVSCIPPNGKSCSLPYPNIQRMQDLLSNSEHN